MNLIDNHIIIRSTRSIKCLSFNSNFYKDIQSNGLSAEYILLRKELYIKESILTSTKKEAIENNFLWLIKVGVLRREVDGQGLTSKVRLTPLGRLILEENPDLPNLKPTPLEFIKNWLFSKFF